MPLRRPGVYWRSPVRSRVGTKILFLYLSKFYRGGLSFTLMTVGSLRLQNQGVVRTRVGVEGHRGSSDTYQT